MQQLEDAAVKAWQSTSRHQTRNLVTPMASRLQAVIECKGFFIQVLKSMVTNTSLCPNTFDPLKMRGTLLEMAAICFLCEATSLTVMCDS